MNLDLTINIPTLVTLLLIGAGIVARFTRVEERLDRLARDFDRHCEEDDQRFATQDGRLRTIEIAVGSQKR